MNDARDINLLGRVLISGYIRTLSGLHIGKGKEGVMVAGVDNAVLRDPMTNEPFIPGSSLKGKLRSLAEKAEPGAQQNWPVVRNRIYIHACTNPQQYQNCPVCRIYGIPSQEKSSAPTRLVCRDVYLEPTSRVKLRTANLDQPYTEIKYEAAIDRVTAAANPRPLERVPRQTLFGPFEMIFSVYALADILLIAKLVETMSLLEDDYLGGSGSRGSGKVSFEELKVTIKPIACYRAPVKALTVFKEKDLAGLFSKLVDIQDTARSEMTDKEAGGE